MVQSQDGESFADGLDNDALNGLLCLCKSLCVIWQSMPTVLTAALSHEQHIVSHRQKPAVSWSMQFLAVSPIQTRKCTNSMQSLPLSQFLQAVQVALFHEHKPV